MMRINLAASDISFGIASLSVALQIIPSLQDTLAICSFSFAVQTVSGCICGNGLMLLSFDIFTTTLLINLNMTLCSFKTNFLKILLGITWLLFFGLIT